MAKATLYYVNTAGIKYGFYSTKTDALRLGKAKAARAGDAGIIIGANNPKPRRAFCGTDTAKTVSFFVDDSVQIKDLVGKATQRGGKIRTVRFR
jgi:hypothetical protein